MVYDAMKRVMKESLEYKHSIYVKNLYVELKKDKIGTTTIEALSKRMCSTLPKHRTRTMVNIVTQWKLQDAYGKLRETKRRNTETWRQKKETIDAAGVRDEFEELWRREITKYEHELKETGEKKLQFLRRKYKVVQTVIPDEMDGIILKEQAIENDDTFTSTPRTYGGVVLTHEETELLSLPPKFAVYEKVENERCQAEIEKSLAKLRWERVATGREGSELPKETKEWKDPETKTMDFRRFKSTDLPFNSRIIVPQPMDDETEVCMQTLKNKLNSCTTDYVAEHNRNNRTTNLTQDQHKGLVSLLKKKKDNEMVIFETDKSKRFSCDTPENYKRLAEVHTENDEEIDSVAKNSYEKLLNAHGGMWLRILNAGDKTNQYDRIRSSMASKNNPPAPLSILRKDHKHYESEVIGPPGRPVCGGDVSYNKRISHLLSMILTDVYNEEKTVCASTEELLAEVEKLNDEGIGDGYVIGSFDVEALYPSLDVDFTVDKVCELFISSKVNIEGVDYKEVGLYMSLNRNDAELSELGIREYCPTRRTNRGRRPNMTGCGTTENEEERYRPWVFPDISEMNCEMKKKMIAEALRVALLTVLKTHTYEFAGAIKLQRNGGPIGMELTGVVAQVFMVWWDREFRERLRRANCQMNLHERYVDDSNVVTMETEVGARYDGERLVVTEDTIREDEGVPVDKRTMLIMQEIASHIHPSIRVTIDYPSNHVDGKVPMLDVKMWIAIIEGRRLILYEHYEKEMSTKAVINAKSAIPTQTKRTVLSQEMLRILLHCSEQLPWATVCTHVNKFMKKLQYSGYSQPFRHNVAKSAMKAFETIKEKKASGIRPINRPKTWRRRERKEEKQRKKTRWYKDGGFDSVLFVPSTPKGQLKKMYQKEIATSGFRIKVVERTGVTLKSRLQRSNPFKPQRCGREQCFVCSSGGTGNCNAESVTYAIKCKGVVQKGTFTRENRRVTRTQGE